MHPTGLVHALQSLFLSQILLVRLRRATTTSRLSFSFSPACGLRLACTSVGCAVQVTRVTGHTSQILRGPVDRDQGVGYAAWTRRQHVTLLPPLLSPNDADLLYFIYFFLDQNNNNNNRGLNQLQKLESIHTGLSSQTSRLPCHVTSVSVEACSSAV